jgi:hypothetical protein
LLAGFDQAESELADGDEDPAIGELRFLAGQHASRS